MKRRGVTVLLGAILAGVLSLLVFSAPVPYVVLDPGPTINTLGRADGAEVIQVSGAKTSTSKGELRLVTIGVRSPAGLLGAIRAWFSPDEAVVPRELIYPPGQSEKQVEQQNVQEFQQSQTSAETAALRVLGYPVRVVVTEVSKDGPSAGKLRAGDVITSVDGERVTSAQRAVDLIQAKPAGSELTIGYDRSGTTGTVTIVSQKADGTDKARIGVKIEERQPHPFKLKIDLNKIGGPSAGLMFALGIIDKLEPADLTGGRIIAGTGTISGDGKVGEIGGIPQKLVAAKDAGATIFLTPKANCAEAVANRQPGLTLVEVSTLRGALDALAKLRSGALPPLCPAR